MGLTVGAAGRAGCAGQGWWIWVGCGGDEWRPGIPESVLEPPCGSGQAISFSESQFPAL